MRTLTKLAPLGLLAGAVAAVQAACGTVPNDTIPGNEVPPAGVIRGTVFYSGPPPCTQDGQIVGNAVILIFDRKNPPPPAGLANTAVNFGVVSGDVLFANVPRTPGSAKVCPGAGAASVTASAPYAISPMAAGSYVMQAFYDYTGDFLATFKFRNLPEATDVGGGYIDINDAQELVPDGNDPVVIDAGIPKGATSPVIITTYPLAPKSSNASYQPIFLPVDIGTPGAVSPKSLRGVPEFTMPGNGFVADNVTVSIASLLNFARPYFYPEGIINPPGQTNAYVTTHGSSATRPAAAVKTPANPSGNVDFVPVLSYPQDIIVDAQPNGSDTSKTKAIDEYQASIPQLLIHWGVPSIETKVATDITSPANPFHLQLNPAATLQAGQAPGGNGGLYVFQYDSTDQQQFNIPEGTVPRLWPLVVLAKLDDDPAHTADPESVTYQGSDGTKPIVIIQGITLSNDSLVNTVYPSLGGFDPLKFRPDPSNLTDHVTVMLRPNVLCLDPRHTDQGGVLVTPALCGPLAANETSQSSNAAACGSATLGNILQPSVTSQPQLTSLVRQGTDASGNPLGLQFGCMPVGRYGVNVVYPTGQAWTTPNEMGSCAAAEGSTVLGAIPKLNDPGTCAGKPRPVLYSQGTRAVIEITPGSPGSCCAQGSKGCLPNAIPPVPAVCTTLPPE